jgi:uncharacterized C2H2 Zn-finger protein
MARPRAKKATTAKRGTMRAQSSRSRRGRFVCPECGRVFQRPQALGAHRRQAHGVVGTSKRTLSRRSTNPGAKPERTVAAQSPATSRTAGRRQSTSDGEVDRDQLLRALFPAGIPARESVIRELNSWLDQAERLARAR